MIALAFALANTAAAVPPSVSIGKVLASPLLDGRCDDAEWQAARATPIGGGVTLLAMQDALAVHFCLQLPLNSLGTFDLYVRDRRGALVNLHSSAQAGERMLTDGKWPDWSFGNHHGWYSPPVPFTGMREQGGQRVPRFREGSSREITLLKSCFDLRRGWRFMIEVRALNADREGEAVFPAGGKAEALESWAIAAG